MKRAILSAAVVLGISVSWGQQDPQFSNFMFDKLSVNPGVAGMHGMYCGTIMYRNQWLGFQGSPKTFLLNVDGSIPAIRGGAGLTFYNDQLGIESNNIIRFAYSYHQRIPNAGVLGIGLSAGYASKAFNGVFNPIDPTDPFVPQNGALNEGALDLNFGLYFKDATDTYYAGLSSTHINGASLGTLNLDIARHYWLMGGYKFRNLIPQWVFVADAMVKSDLASTQFDIAARAWYNDMVYGGVSYRHQDAIYPMVGYRKGFKLDDNGSMGFLTTGLAYDITLSDIRNYSNGTVEMFVKFCYKPVIKLNPPKIIDVRHLGT